jgi:hypothetical protein
MHTAVRFQAVAVRVAVAVEDRLAVAFDRPLEAE